MQFVWLDVSLHILRTTMFYVQYAESQKENVFTILDSINDTTSLIEIVNLSNRIKNGFSMVKTHFYFHSAIDIGLANQMNHHH